MLLDNFDSFTYNLVDYFNQIGISCKIFRNNVALSEITRHSYSGIVLSPGPGTPVKAGNLMQVIAHYQSSLPVLGICLGHQALGEYFGARLEKAAVPMHGKIDEIITTGDYLFQGLPKKIKVVRYHSLVLYDLPEILSATAMSTGDEIMGIRHKYLPISGLQFHPEAVMTDSGLSMLRNWTLFNNIEH